MDEKQSEWPVCDLSGPGPRKDWGRCPKCGTEAPVWHRPLCFPTRLEIGGKP